MLWGRMESDGPDYFEPLDWIAGGTDSSEMTFTHVLSTELAQDQQGKGQP